MRRIGTKTRDNSRCIKKCMLMRVRMSWKSYLTPKEESREKGEIRENKNKKTEVENRTQKLQFFRSFFGGLGNTKSY